MKRRIICFLTLSILYFIVFPRSSFAVLNWSKVQNKPILTYGEANNWNSQSVGSPSVTYDGNNFRMWFEATNGSVKRIGTTISSDGINWNQDQSLVSDLININDVNIHDPKILIKDNVFMLWYSASNFNISKIKINFSSSSNGNSWNLPIRNVIPPGLEWDNDKGISFPFTIFINNQYKMWYGAHGTYQGTTHWRIGYATSPDGITWTKHPDPVLLGEPNWDGPEVGNPSVLLEDGIYHMWYHGDVNIFHATSSAGIIWTKDKTAPALTRGPNAFDIKRVLNPFVLKKDGILYMYYTGIGSDDRWQIGLATSEVTPSPTPSSTPTPTPSPTATPTPSPTTTLSPTPSLTPTLIPTPTGFSPSFLSPASAHHGTQKLFSPAISNRAVIGK